MNPERFFPWIQKVTQTDGPNILRLKGIIAFKGDAERYVVQGVHMIIEGDHQRPWKEDEKRESRLVFIGRELDREKLEKASTPASPRPEVFKGRTETLMLGALPVRRHPRA